jgi:hypothetical protein
MGCFGDESRLCCNVEFKEQRAIATGVMMADVRTSASGRIGHWSFKGPAALCSLKVQSE